MSFHPKMTVANFTCRFGEKFVLLDLFKEIIEPAFFNSPPREFRGNNFYLFNLEFMDAGIEKSPNPVIIGRFVRDTNLQRNYVLRESILIEDEDEIESATAAKFILILSTHTLIYVTETPYAPPISMFRSTIQYHLNKSWAMHLKQVAKERQRQKNSNATSDKKTSLRDELLKLIDEIPKPDLEINELPTQLSIKNFLDKFKTIDKVEYRILDTNHTTDFTPLIKQLREQKTATNSTQIIVIENKPKNKGAVASQLHDSVADGNVKAIINGISKSGGKIKGSNDMFSLSIPLEGLPSSMIGFAKQVLLKYKSLISNGDILVHNPKNTDKLKSITPKKKLDD